MFFRSPLAVGAILFLAGLNHVGANETDESRNLRGSDENELPDTMNRYLTPFGFGQGYGYTTNNNRFSTQRVRGPGSQRLRPVAPAPVRAYMGPATPPKTGKATKGVGKKIKSIKNKIKSVKGNFGGKGKGAKKSAKYDTSGSSSRAAPIRGSYLNAMNWERVPGQPIFVSDSELPIILLDEEPVVVIDEDGNTILTDGQGNEIVVTTNEEGQQVVDIIIAPSASPTEASSKVTESPTATAE